MLSPSTAPRWNTAMSVLRRATVPWAAAARRRKRGMPPRPMPSALSAPPFMKARRVQESMLSPLELGRAEHERSELLDVGVAGAAIVRGGSHDLGAMELRDEHLV